jgi:uncharacterized protein YjiS (DUF1127 family)
MSAVTTNTAPRASLRDLIARVAPVRVSRDPFGIASGFRAYRVYTALDDKSDSELAALGLTRQDIARVAADSITR